MKLPAPPASSLLVSALVLALGLGACARSQHLSSSLTGPGGNGSGSAIGASGRMGDTDFTPAVPCPAMIPCTLDSACKFVASSALVSSFRADRLRIETSGEIAGPSLEAMGPCASSDNPSIRFLGGHADVLLHGTTQSVTVAGQPLVFGPLMFAGTNLEPGLVFASDAQNDVIEIIWPQLAGTGPGGVIVRVQLAHWNTLLVSTAASYDVVFDLTAERDGVQMAFKGHADNLRLDGVAVPQEGAAPPLVCPPSVAGTDAAVTPVFAGIVQFRANRIRLDVDGDTPDGTLNAMAACATANPAPIAFVGGAANLVRAGTQISVTGTGQPLTFGPLLAPLTLEAGALLATDAGGNVLEIIWPALAGLPAGPPILRLQLAGWNSWVRTGQYVDVSMRFDAVGPDGAPASYTADAKNVLVPGVK